MTQLAIIQNDDIPQIEATDYIPKEVGFVKPFENQLALIEDEFSKFVFDYGDKDQNDAARSLISKLRKSKSAIEKVAKAERDPAIKYQRHVIAEEDKLVARVQKMIDLYDKPLKEWESKDQLRKDKILEFIADMRPPIDYILLAPSSELNLILGRVQHINPEIGFDEFSSQCFAQRIITIEYLKEHIAIAEKRESDAAELEKLRAEAETRRIADEAKATQENAEKEEKERLAREQHEAEIREAEELQRQTLEAERIQREREDAATAERKRVEAESAERERVLREQAEKAEAERIAAEQKSAADALAAEERRLRESKEAEERQAAAVEEERRRVATEERERERNEASKSADREHRRKIHGEIVAGMLEVKVGDLHVTESVAKQIVIAICGDAIPHLKILY